MALSDSLGESGPESEGHGHAGRDPGGPLGITALASTILSRGPGPGERWAATSS